jgi:hypothetical protein
MSTIDRKSNNHQKSVVAILAVLVVAASAMALASSLSANLVRTAAAEVPSMPHISNHLTPDRINYGPIVGGNETATTGNETATTGNETATTGNETATTGNETATTGNETATTGNETIDNSTG